MFFLLVIGFITKPSIKIFKNEIKIAIKNAGMIPFNEKFDLPRMRLVIYNIITLDSGYNIPQVIIVRGIVI